MQNLLSDIIVPDDYDRLVRPPHHTEVTDTVDTITGLSQQMADGVQSGGGSKTTIILGAVLAVLVALGICLLMIRAYRRRTEPQVATTRL